MLLDFLELCSTLRSLTIETCVLEAMSTYILVYNFFLNQCRKDITIQNGFHPQLVACYTICINDFLLDFFLCLPSSTASL